MEALAMVLFIGDLQGAGREGRRGIDHLKPQKSDTFTRLLYEDMEFLR